MAHFFGSLHKRRSKNVKFVAKDNSLVQKFPFVFDVLREGVASLTWYTADLCLLCIGHVTLQVEPSVLKNTLTLLRTSFPCPPYKLGPQLNSMLYRKLTSLWLRRTGSVGSWTIKKQKQKKTQSDHGNRIHHKASPLNAAP